MKAEHLSRLAADADRCVRCGLCIPLCPTWQASGNEGESPRGRIVAMARLAAGDSSRRNEAARLLDSCLGCGLCQQACPSDVPYMRMIGPAKMAAGGSRPAAAALARLATAAGGDRILAAGMAAARIAAALPLPGRLRRLAGLLPRPNRGSRLDIPAAARADGPKVMLFRGCFGSSLDQAAQTAARRLLAACGYRLTRQGRQACCGSLPEHAGLIGRARRAGARNRSSLAASGTTIATTASGCAAGLAAQHPSLPLADACELVLARLERLAAPAQPGDRQLRIILHVPCSQTSAAGAAGLLRKIPAARVSETPAGQCCGAGGMTWLSHPRQAEFLADRIVQPIIADADDRTVIACPNHPCARHLERALARKGHRMLIRHPLEIFAQNWFAETGGSRVPVP